MAKTIKIIGDAFIQLLQRTVLPYGILSLITGPGNFGGQDALSLAKKGEVNVTSVELYLDG